MILKETIELLQLKYKEIFQRTIIEKLVIGMPNTGVILSNGYCGVAKTDERLFNNYHNKRNFEEFSPGKISGQRIIDLFNFPDPTKVLSVVKLAVLNAVSSEIIQKSDYMIIEDKDPLELINLNKQKNICIVGAFHSYINKISKTNNKLYVLELDATAFSEDHIQYYKPAEMAPEIFKISDIIIITGSTLANNTIDRLLGALPEQAQVIVVGPTSSIIPDILFRHNVDIIGSIRITDNDKAMSIISEGGAGYHLLKYCAKKICLINDHKK
ncbi:MAG: DUF364 domain-containing protein [Bacteroidales bacterium]|nr:DUF364 domain-containing protein [Bacteroidales bacterium]